MAISNTLFHILSLFLLFLVLANKLVHSQQDVTSFRIDSFNQVSDGLKYEGHAVVPRGSNFLSLIVLPDTDTGVSSVGRVSYLKPIQFWDFAGRQASFETTIEFVIAPKYITPAEGMTFFIVPVNSLKPIGGEDGGFGIFNGKSPIFAVEFDPYVNPEDPKFRHIGIDINTKTSLNVTNFENGIGEVVSARISYDGLTKRISVVTSYGLESSTVEYVYDLQALLPQQVQVGLSAATGPNNVAKFDVFSWHFTSTLVAGYTNFIKSYVD